MSSNPFADYHLIYAVVLIALAAVGAGATWGLGKVWARLPVVSRHTWLK
jgi:thiosulfate dehydrogenase [quinone] large subunit